jgi:hypothetical protein
LLCGIKLFDKDGVSLFAEGYDDYMKDYKSHETILEEGERLVGFKSRKDTHTSRHWDFEFLIGKLE